MEILQKKRKQTKIEITLYIHRFKKPEGLDLQL